VRDLEIVVVDDGSSDDTETAVKQLGLTELTYHGQPNAGPAAARNRGVELSCGTYIAFLDTGDVADPDWLAGFDLMVRVYDCSFVSCAADLTRNGALVRTVRPRRLGPGSGEVVALFRTGAFAIRRDLFERVGGFDPALRFSEVTELGMRVGQELSGQSGVMTHITRSLVSVELPPDGGAGGRSTSNAYSDRRRLETALHILDKHREVMARTPRLRQTYLHIAGVASARLGDYDGARRYLWRAWWARPTDARELGRLAVASVPPFAARVWPAQG
jgi:glycosyltransferase involved in cell wall biosynthesis